MVLLRAMVLLLAVVSKQLSITSAAATVPGCIPNLFFARIESSPLPGATYLQTTLYVCEPMGGEPAWQIGDSRCEHDFLLAVLQQLQRPFRYFTTCSPGGVIMPLNKLKNDAVNVSICVGEAPFPPFVMLISTLPSTASRPNDLSIICRANTPQFTANITEWHWSVWNDTSQAFEPIAADARFAMTTHRNASLLTTTGVLTIRNGSIGANQSYYAVKFKLFSGDKRLQQPYQCKAVNWGGQSKKAIYPTRVPEVVQISVIRPPIPRRPNTLQLLCQIRSFYKNNLDVQVAWSYTNEKGRVEHIDKKPLHFVNTYFTGDQIISVLAILGKRVPQSGEGYNDQVTCAAANQFGSHALTFTQTAKPLMDLYPVFGGRWGKLVINCTLVVYKGMAEFTYGVFLVYAHYNGGGIYVYNQSHSSFLDHGSVLVTWVWAFPAPNNRTRYQCFGVNYLGSTPITEHLVKSIKPRLNVTSTGTVAGRPQSLLVSLGMIWGTDSEVGRVELFQNSHGQVSTLYTMQNLTGNMKKLDVYIARPSDPNLYHRNTLNLTWQALSYRGLTQAHIGSTIEGAQLSLVTQNYHDGRYLFTISCSAQVAPHLHDITSVKFYLDSGDGGGFTGPYIQSTYQPFSGYNFVDGFPAPSPPAGNIVQGSKSFLIKNYTTQYKCVIENYFGKATPLTGRVYALYGLGAVIRPPAPANPHEITLWCGVHAGQIGEVIAFNWTRQLLNGTHDPVPTHAQTDTLDKQANLVFSQLVLPNGRALNATRHNNYKCTATTLNGQLYTQSLRTVGYPTFNLRIANASQGVGVQFIATCTATALHIGLATSMFWVVFGVRETNFVLSRTADSVTATRAYASVPLHLAQQWCSVYNSVGAMDAQIDTVQDYNFFGDNCNGYQLVAVTKLAWEPLTRKDARSMCLMAGGGMTLPSFLISHLPCLKRFFLRSLLASPSVRSGHGYKFWTSAACTSSPCTGLQLTPTFGATGVSSTRFSVAYMTRSDLVICQAPGNATHPPVNGGYARGYKCNGKYLATFTNKDFYKNYTHAQATQFCADRHAELPEAPFQRGMPGCVQSFLFDTFRTYLFGDTYALWSKTCSATACQLFVIRPVLPGGSWGQTDRSADPKTPAHNFFHMLCAS